MSINNINKRLINLYLREINYCNKTINKGRPNKEELNHYIDVIFKAVKLATPWRELNEKLHFRHTIKNLLNGISSTYLKIYIKLSLNYLILEIYYLMITQIYILILQCVKI